MQGTGDGRFGRSDSRARRLLGSELKCTPGKRGEGGGGGGKKKGAPPLFFFF